jgi:hypothetical protein
MGILNAKNIKKARSQYRTWLRRRVMKSLKYNIDYSTVSIDIHSGKSLKNIGK